MDTTIHQLQNQQKCRYDACITVEKEVKPEGEIGYKTLEGGSMPSFSTKEHIINFHLFMIQFFSNWLPNSPYQLRDSPSFESYINDPGVRKEEEYETLLYIPIQ